MDPNLRFQTLTLIWKFRLSQGLDSKPQCLSSAYTPLILIQEVLDLKLPTIRLRLSNLNP